MGQKKKNPAIKSSGATSSKASPLPDWVKNKDIPKPAPSYTKAGKEAAAAKKAPAAAPNAAYAVNAGTAPAGSGSAGAPAAAAQGSSAGAPKSNGTAGSGTGTGSGLSAVAGAGPGAGEQVHLFPPGSKTPLNLLYEKVQKLHAKDGWEKPLVEVKRLPSPLVRRWLDARARVRAREERERETAGKAGAAGKGKGKAKGKDEEDASEANGTAAGSPAATAAAAGESSQSSEEQDVLDSLGIEAGTVGLDADGSPLAYTATVILRKHNKQNTSQPFVVKLAPNDERLDGGAAAFKAHCHSSPSSSSSGSREPPLHLSLRIFAESSLHAKHWAATYALFRLHSNLSMNLMLPSGPREYWTHLSAYSAQLLSAASALSAKLTKNSSPQQRNEQRKLVELHAFLFPAPAPSDPFEAQAKRDALRAERDASRLREAQLRSAVQAGDHERAAAIAREKEKLARQAKAKAANEGPSSTSGSGPGAGSGAGAGGSGGGSMTAEALAAEAARLERERDGYREKMARIWAEAPELHLPARLRELAERTIRTGMELFPGATTATPGGSGAATPAGGARSGTATPTTGQELGSASPVPSAALVAQLQSQGFRKGYALSAASWVSSARAALSSSNASASAQAAAAAGTAGASRALLHAVRDQSDLDAALEYLLVYTPEDDLPPKYRKSTPSREDFVTAINSNSNSGTGAGAGLGEGESLSLRWMQDRLVKQAGFLRSAVEATTKEMLAFERSRGASGAAWPPKWRQAILLDLLLARLGGTAAGDATESVLQSAAALGSGKLQDGAASASKEALDDEFTAVQAILGEERVSLVPENDWPSAQPDEQTYCAYDIAIDAPPGSQDEIRLRRVPHPASRYPSPAAEEAGGGAALPSFYIASRTLPAYLKLALTQALHHAMSGVAVAGAREGAHAELAEALKWGEGGLVLRLVELLEEILPRMLDHPPALASVMAGLLQDPRSAKTADAAAEGQDEDGRDVDADEASRRGKRQERKPRPLRADPKVDAQLQQRAQRWEQSKDYTPLKKTRHSLPAWAAKQELLALLASNRVVIVAGETGCGKTTQCPQFILDEHIASGNASQCNIIVTQPRRVSAMGVAARVAAERGERLDSAASVQQDAVVGYAIRGERKASRDCRLLFTTTGVLLRRLSAGGDPDLVGVSHVIVDEVHERNVDSDFLLLELKEVLKRNKKLKVVLMSATIQQVRKENAQSVHEAMLTPLPCRNSSPTTLAARRACPSQDGRSRLPTSTSRTSSSSPATRLRRPPSDRAASQRSRTRIRSRASGASWSRWVSTTTKSPRSSSCLNPTAQTTTSSAPASG